MYRLGIDIGGTFTDLVIQDATSGLIQTIKVPSTCPCRKLNPHILMVQSAQDWQRQNAAHGLDGTRYRRILVQ